MLLWVTKVFECFIYAEHKGGSITDWTSDFVKLQSMQFFHIFSYFSPKFSMKFISGFCGVFNILYMIHSFTILAVCLESLKSSNNLWNYLEIRNNLSRQSFQILDFCKSLIFNRFCIVSWCLDITLTFSVIVDIRATRVLYIYAWIECVFRFYFSVEQRHRHDPHLTRQSYFSFIFM